MINVIQLPGLRAESLLGFLAALGAFRLIAQTNPKAKLRWNAEGGGWTAELHVSDEKLTCADKVVDAVYAETSDSSLDHPILEWERFLGKAFTDECIFYRRSALAALSDPSAAKWDFLPVFTSQQPVKQGDVLEHFDHPFRAARKDYYLGNLKSVLERTRREHIFRTLVRPWDYRDAMANQSLRLDHGDDRRHAYQWHAPTEDPARQKIGCMLGANRLAIEAFPLFPCIAASSGGMAVGFTCVSKTLTWINWPIWNMPCSLPVISSMLNLASVHDRTPRMAELRQMGIDAVMRTRRLPIEKNKVFLPPESIAS